MAAPREARLIGRRINEIRTKQGVSRVRLAQLAGGDMTSPKIARIERGGIRPDEVPVITELIRRIEEDRKDVPVQPGEDDDEERRLAAVVPLVRRARIARTRSNVNAYLDRALKVLAEGVG